MNLEQELKWSHSQNTVKFTYSAKFTFPVFSITKVSVLRNEKSPSFVHSALQKVFAKKKNHGSVN